MNRIRGWDAAAQKLHDEPDDHFESVLTARLTVEKDLEPKWTVVCDRNPDGVPFKQADRNKVGVGLIGVFSERELSWANGTALAKLTAAQSLSELLANASRTARSSLDVDRAVTLTNFDNAATKSQEIAKLLGVPVLDAYKAHLDLASINLKVGGLSLHDGEIPLRQLGLGSRRMLQCGIQKAGLEEGHITLFDELEFGLEANLLLPSTTQWAAVNRTPFPTKVAVQVAPAPVDWLIAMERQSPLWAGAPLNT